MSKPLIAIVGNTGVGKSQLSIELAKALNGEIINGDSMQVYRGLDAMTNKHPIPERRGIAHHLLGHIDWHTEYSIKQFEDEAKQKVRRLFATGKLRS
jgi:tRNA dimethylallyltransferase